MRKFLIFMFGILLLFAITGVANAGLLKIGTATYGGSDYNLIWNDDNNGNSLIWLDYTNGVLNWEDQKAWAAGLDSSLTYHIDASYAITWIDEAWRLPSAEADPAAGNERTSEMGNLYYKEFGLQKRPGGPYYTADDLNDNSCFDNLSVERYYWSGTESQNNPANALAFWLGNGFQGALTKTANDFLGLAVRSGQVDTVSAPEPATILFLGFGLIGLAGLRRKA